MTLTEKDRILLINHNIEKADACIKEIRILLDNNLLNTAINRIYYGIFYILTSLALKHNFETSKHLQLIGWFNKNFIKNNVIDKKFGQILHEAYDSRSKGDYGNFIEFHRDKVETMYLEMQEFINKIKAIL